MCVILQHHALLIEATLLKHQSRLDDFLRNLQASIVKTKEQDHSHQHFALEIYKLLRLTRSLFSYPENNLRNNLEA